MDRASPKLTKLVRTSWLVCFLVPGLFLLWPAASAFPYALPGRTPPPPIEQPLSTGPSLPDLSIFLLASV